MDQARSAKSRKPTKISRMSVVDQVGASIKKDIADGVWKAGEKIPSEAELAEMFGVNRLSVRMALQKLSTLGIIETRVGEGSFVRPFSLRPFLSEIAVFYEDEKKYREVQQLRNLLEGECMNLAILSATEEEKQELHELLKQYNRELDEFQTNNIDDPELLDRVVDADLAFHYQVVKMSHNGLYKDVYYMVQQLIRRHISHLLNSRVHRRAEAGLPLTPGDDTHTQIYEGIIHGDVEATRKAREEVLGIIPVYGLDTFD